MLGKGQVGTFGLFVGWFYAAGRGQEQSGEFKEVF